MEKCLAHYRWTPRRLVGRAAEEIRTSWLRSETNTNGVVARYPIPERELRGSGLAGPIGDPTKQVIPAATASAQSGGSLAQAAPSLLVVKPPAAFR
jgi:hypothetical protein